METSTEKNATPVLMALDEAGNIKPPKLEERLKIGRFRNTPYLLGFQDVSQLKKHFQENGAKAVLAGIRNQIFLPGIDNDTGIYASSLLGATTVLSRTEVDAPGTKLDSERVSESRRDFRQAPELRRLVDYHQAIAIIGTCDPVLFRFPPRADLGEVTIAPRRRLASPQTLAQAVAEMKQIKAIEQTTQKTANASQAQDTKESNVPEVNESDKSPRPQRLGLNQLIPNESPEPTRAETSPPEDGTEKAADERQNELPFNPNDDEEEPCAA